MSGQEFFEAIFGAIAGNESIMNLDFVFMMIGIIGSILLGLNGLYRMLVPLPGEEFWGLIGRIIQICFAFVLLVVSTYIPLSYLLGG